MMNLEVLYENSKYLVVNKEAGLISEKNPFENNTVEDQVLDYLLLNNPKPYIGVIHRLDRVTSGVLIFAKKKNILVHFNNLFSNRKVQKTYLAIVSKKPSKNKEHLNHFLVKNNLEKRADIVKSESKDTLECRLSYEVIDQNEHGYLLEVKPTTGRFHQIRAQLSHIGLPIIGDEKYGSDQDYLPLAICLHAWKLSYKIAGSEDIQTFQAPLPKNNFWKFKSV
ncbi:RNA pseudouridine synthase [Bizionia myxarmorum]|uniref:RNA pseudouridine synthase n=2 Tax=Bizionia myxarmorum TaxID=291186 RepID=A0A5D0R4X2_9FLAO|nr:RNA pseudouridine synthase [Bizionia myxarmorum]